MSWREVEGLVGYIFFFYFVGSGRLLIAVGDALDYRAHTRGITRGILVMSAMPD